MRVDINLNATELSGFSKSLCAQLAAYGLSLTKLTAFKRNFAYNGTVTIGEMVVLEACKVDAYSYVAPGVRMTNVAVGRFSTIGHSGALGLVGHGLNHLTTNNALNKQTVFDFATPQMQRNSLWLKRNQGEFLLPITIGHDVHIEPHVFVPKGGATIGTGALIRANTVVTKDIPPYAIVAMGERGGQIVGYRFSDEIIADLMASKWWEYDLPALLASGIEVPLYDIQAFIAFIHELSLANSYRLADNWRYLMSSEPEQVTLYDVTADCQLNTLYPQTISEQTVLQAREEISRQESYQKAREQQHIAKDNSGQATSGNMVLYPSLNGCAGITLVSQNAALSKSSS